MAIGGNIESRPLGYTADRAFSEIKCLAKTFGIETIQEDLNAQDKAEWARSNKCFSLEMKMDDSLKPSWLLPMRRNPSCHDYFSSDN